MESAPPTEADADAGLPPLRPNPPPDRRPGKRVRGIDIHDAMSILSSRAASGGDRVLLDGSEAVSDEHKSMGQTIDLSDEGSGQGCGCGVNANEGGGLGGESGGTAPDGAAAAEERGAEEEEQRREQREKRRAEIRSSLERMSARDLLGALFEAQRERTTAYKTYDSGLDTVLKTGNITQYPAVCARATASFSVLSDTINTIRGVLSERHGRKDLARQVRNLQNSEREKLNATAALHLERIREKNEEAAAGTADGGDERIRNLLKDGVASLKAKIAGLIEAINETLEELRYAMAEED